MKSLQSLTGSIVHIIVKLYPNLKSDLYNSHMNETVPRFVMLSLALSLIMTIVLSLPTIWIINSIVENYLWLVSLLVFVIFFSGIFSIVLHLPKLNLQSRGKEIESKISVTGRRLLIQLESGKSLINSIIEVAKHKEYSDKDLERIAYELYTGQPLENVIKRAIKNSPSPTFRRIFTQINNSLRTGSDLRNTLEATLERITEEKLLEFESFGKKLNPVGLLYMILGTIAPTLGIVVVVIFLTLMGISVGSVVLIFLLSVILVIQIFFMFLFSKMRPRLEI